jgi:hypothetical protein
MSAPLSGSLGRGPHWAVRRGTGALAIDGVVVLDVDDLRRRAERCYRRRCRRIGAICQQPNSGLSGVIYRDGTPYLQLANSHGVLALFRVRPSKRLALVEEAP